MGQIDPQLFKWLQIGLKEAVHINGYELYADFLPCWLSYKRKFVRENTYYQYCSTAKKIAAYFRERNLKLKDIAYPEIQEYFDVLYDLGYDPETMKKQRSIINQSLDHAIRLGLIKENPCRLIVLPRKVKVIMNFLSEEQLLTLFDAVKNSTMGPVIILARYYGLRRSEVLGLRWDAINFQSDIISITRTSVLIGGAVSRTTNVKAPKSRRSFPLLPVVKEYLIDIYKTRSSVQPDDYICINRKGAPISPSTVTHAFHDIIIKLGLPHVRLHDLRHSCAALLLNHGHTLSEVQEWLGHDSITSTNIYAHITYTSKLRMADTISDVLR